MSKIYLEILDPVRKQVFEQLKSFDLTCYLAGGTALALQLGHRRSFDFDLFTPQPIGHMLHKQVKEVFGEVVYSLNTADQITYTSDSNISITFLYYWFPLLNQKNTTSSISLASIEDIMADKAHTIGRRAIWRDYVDIYYVLKNNIMNVGQIITSAQKKFSGEFVTEQFLEQLAYYDDVEIIDVDWLKDAYDTDDIQKYLTHVAQQELKRLLT